MIRYAGNGPEFQSRVFGAAGCLIALFILMFSPLGIIAPEVRNPAGTALCLRYRLLAPLPKGLEPAKAPDREAFEAPRPSDVRKEVERKEVKHPLRQRAEAKQTKKGVPAEPRRPVKTAEPPVAVDASSAKGSLEGAISMAADGPASDQATSIGTALPASRVYEESTVDQMPIVVERQEPDYPYRARRMNVTGAVEVRFLVDEQGMVKTIEIVRAHPEGFFEEAVREAVGKWRFVPGLKDGRKVATWVRTTINFELK